MNVTVTTRHKPVEEAAKNYAQDRIGRVVGAFAQRLEQAQVVIDKESLAFVVESVVQGPHGAHFAAKADHEDLRTAIDQMAKKLETQIRQWKGKLVDQKHGQPGRARGPETEG